MNNMNHFIHCLHRLKTRGINISGFIDAGAHFGETNIIMRQIYPEARVISFEANLYCEDMLKANAPEYIICLLGNQNKENINFYLDSKDVSSTGCSIYKEKSQHFNDAIVVELQMYKLDDIIPDEANIQFLKMDVQGAEIDILDGASRLLNKIKYVYAEVSFEECNEGAPLFDDLYNYMRSKGYKISDIVDSTYINNKFIQTNILFEKL